MRTLREDVFFRSLDPISHDVSSTENFRMIERSRHDKRWGVNSAQATLDWELKWLSLNRQNYMRQLFRLLAKCSIAHQDRADHVVGYLGELPPRIRVPLPGNSRILKSGLKPLDKHSRSSVYSVQRNTFDDITLNIHLVFGDIVYGYAQSWPLF